MHARANQHVTTSKDRAWASQRQRVTVKPPDALLLGSVAFLVALGLVMVFSASSATAYADYHDTAHYLKRQVVYLIVGLVVAYGVYRLDYRKLRGIAPGVVAVSFVLLVVTLIPHVGFAAGARRAVLSVPARPPARLSRPVEGRAEHRLPHRAVAARARQRRPVRPRPRRLTPEILLPADAAHRLHLRGDRRRAGHARLHRGDRPVPAVRRPRHHARDPSARPLRNAARARLHVHDRDPSVHQHRRRHVVVAGHRRPAPLHVVRRHLTRRLPDRRRPHRQHHPPPPCVRSQPWHSSSSS